MLLAILLQMHFSSLLDQFITFISALTSSPSLGPKISHIWYATAYVQLGVGLNSKQRQRQNTDEFRCKLHLLLLDSSTLCREELETTVK